MDPALKIVASVCRLPRDFREKGTVSMRWLLETSGYMARADEITERHLETYLREHPELVNWWIAQSEDNRGSPAWYLQERTDAHKRGSAWVVGCYPGAVRQEFTDRFEACAFYIKRFVEEVRNS